MLLRVLFLLSFLCLYKVTRCQDIEEIKNMLEGLNEMLAKTKLSRIPRDSEEISAIWEKYEFGTGAGNREELVIRNISVHEEADLLKADVKWEYLQGNGLNYLACAENHTLFLYQLNSTIVAKRSRIEFQTEGHISSFKIIAVDETKARAKDHIVIVLCIENNNTTILQWYNVFDQRRFERFWLLSLQKSAKIVEIIQYESENKLFLLDSSSFNQTDKHYSSVEIYAFTNDFTKEAFDFWLCQRIPLPETYHVKACQIYESTILAVQSSDEVLLYDCTGDYTAEGIFKRFQSLKSNHLQNFICFDSGYIEYLAISGSNAGLFNYVNSEFECNVETEEFFNGILDVKWIENIPMESYRDESLLLVQLENSTVLALTWQGEGFKEVPLPNRIIDGFDLAKITPIPGYGFVSANKFVRIESELRDLPRLHGNEIEGMVKTKALLQEVLEKQEMLIDEIDAHVDRTYLNNPLFTGVWNASVVDVVNVTIEGEDFKEYKNFNASAFEETLTALEDELSRLKSILDDTVDANSTEVNLTDVEIRGNLFVNGTLYAGELQLDSLNGMKMTDFVKEFVDEGEVLIEGEKSFTTIEATNFKIHSLNGIPIKDIIFADSKADYSYVKNLSSINTATIRGDLNFDTINGINWRELMENVVWKNKMTFFPHKIVVKGAITAEKAKITSFNGLHYPSDYILQNDTATVNVTGYKTFEKLTTNRLTGLRSINGIDVDQFIILGQDHVLDHEITFRNLIVTGTCRIDGKMSGTNLTSILQEPFIDQIANVSSNLIFYNLTVNGSVYLEESLNNETWSDFEDILLKTESNVEITGKKRFLAEVEIASPINITSGIINGHPIDDFVTLEGDQEFPNLEEISAEVSFGNVTYGFIEELEKMQKENYEKSGTNCLNQSIIFKVPPIVDEISFDTLNGNYSSDYFAERFNKTLETIHFENLNVTTLEVNELTAERINGVDIKEFTENRVTRNTAQNLTGNITIDRLETDILEAEQINGLTIEQWNDLINHFQEAYEQIFSGKITLETLNVTGCIETPSVNGVPLKERYGYGRMETVVFENGLSVENLTVLNRLNGLNFTEMVSDAVMKSDKNIIVTGRKTFERVNTKYLEATYLNGHVLENLLDPYKEQTLKGPVIVNGTVNVLEKLEVLGNVNGVPFDDLINKFKWLNNETLEIRGDYEFPSDMEIENARVNGSVQGINFNKFVESLVLKGQDNVVLSGSIVFRGPVTFKGFLVVDETLNDLNLKEFYERAIFIDKPFAVNSTVVFKGDIFVEKELTINRDLKCKTIAGVDMENLTNSVVYIDKPMAFLNTVTFTNVVFEGDVKVERWNDMDMNLVIPLHTEQTIPVDLIRAVNITVGKIDIQGTVNGYNLEEIKRDTLMKIGNQNVTGDIKFLGKVHVRRDFDARLINGHSPKKIVLTNTDDVITGNFVFEDAVTLNDSLRVLGRLNGIDPLAWEKISVTTDAVAASSLQQIIYEKWRIHGNVDFANGVDGDGLLNGLNATQLADALERSRLKLSAGIPEMEGNLQAMCEDTRSLQNYARNQLYKFNEFGYLQILQFDEKVVSVHYFQLDDLDFILVSHDECHLNVFQYTGTKFELVARVPDFGYVERWITLRHEEQLYFLAIGRPACGRTAANLWRLEDVTFVHVSDCGNAVDAMKLTNDTFLLLFENHVEKRSIERMHQTPYAVRKNLRFVQNSERILLHDREVIYEYNDDFSNYTSWTNPLKSEVIVAFKVGIYRTEVLLHRAEETMQNFVMITSGDFSETKILQTVEAYRPSSFVIMNFEGLIETLLIFVENDRNLQIYEYRGIANFAHRDTIKLKADKIFELKIRKYSDMTRRRCLAVLKDNRLTILEAKMHGEKLDIPELSCPIN